jgi:hypothetical protein
MNITQEHSPEQFSEQDMIDFAKFCFKQNSSAAYVYMSPGQRLILWKEQRPENLIYEG